MKIGSLIRVQHFGSRYNGKVGTLMSVRKMAGFRDTYFVRVAGYDFEIGLTKEQCGVICDRHEYKVGNLVQHSWSRQVGVVVEIATFTMNGGTQWAKYKVHWSDGDYGVCVGSELRKVIYEGR